MTYFVRKRIKSRMDTTQNLFFLQQTRTLTALIDKKESNTCASGAEFTDQIWHQKSPQQGEGNVDRLLDNYWKQCHLQLLQRLYSLADDPIAQRHNTLRRTSLSTTQHQPKHSN